MSPDISPDDDREATRVALVTGAAQGMGAACARRLLRDGVRIVAFDLRDSGIEDSVSVRGDVTSSEDVARAVGVACERFGRLDILVNAAGVLRPTRLLEMTEEEWDWVVAVNLKGSFLTSRAAAKPMVERGFGRIVHFSSTAGKTVSTIGGSHYTAAKHGVLGLTRALAKELAPHGVTVNAVCPGLIDTEMVRQTISPEAVARFEASFPIPRLGTPEEVAELIAFLTSDRASYITGAALDINGGDFLA
jgi:NAD(P)-dependent dehydrogenase (short-subunit alcohol dehydrogenase family)